MKHIYIMSGKCCFRRRRSRLESRHFSPCAVPLGRRSSPHLTSWLAHGALPLDPALDVHGSVAALVLVACYRERSAAVATRTRSLPIAKISLSADAASGGALSPSHAPAARPVEPRPHVWHSAAPTLKCVWNFHACRV